MSVENLSEEKDWNMLGTLKSLKAVLDDLMEQEGDWDKIYNHFGYMAENETEAKKKLLYISDVEYTDGEAKEARKSAIEMIEGIEDEALLELMYKYMKRVIDEEKEKKNG